MANERTFLSWIRTALALIAGGVALLGVVAGAAALCALIPIASRTRQLRHHVTSPATWQPIALVTGLLLLAASFLLLG